MESGPSTPDPRAAASQTAIRRVLWASFLLALLAYGVLGYTLFGRSEAVTPFPTWLWPVVAAVFAAAAFFVPGALADQLAAKAGAQTMIRPSEIIGWAFAEGVAVVGLVSVILGGPKEPLVLYLAAAAAILWLRRPTD
jgi:hypothetical protein